MTCDRCRDILIDYVYGEASDADRREVDEHLAACDSCRAELASLRLARSAVGRLEAPDSSDFSRRCETLLQTPPGRGFRLRRWAISSGALAASVLVVFAVWLFHQQTLSPTEAAISGPVEIRQTAVSLVIFSRPGPQAPPGWSGLASVRDSRVVRNLRKGRSTVELTGVPAFIFPESVELRGLEAPEGLRIVEQRFRPRDLRSSDDVIDLYTNKPVTVRTKSGPDEDAVGRVQTGLLLDADGGVLIQPEGQPPRSIDGKSIEAVTMGKLPEGLRTRPALEWDLENRAASRQRFEVSYVTAGLEWQADYTVTVNLGDGKPLRAGAAQGPEVIDTGELVGYATLRNTSGVTYENAQVKLMSGDMVKDVSAWHRRFVPAAVPDPSRRTLSAHGNYFGHHAYTLPRPITLTDGESKQVELLTGQGIRMRRRYLYHAGVDGRRPVAVFHEFANTAANGLGVPLPGGRVSLYVRQADGESSLVLDSTIRHTPAGEMIRLAWGNTAEVTGSRKLLERADKGPERRTKVQYELRSHKDHDVTVTVWIPVAWATYQFECALPWHVREAGQVEIDVPVKARGVARVEAAWNVNYQSGGALVSPYDRKEE